MEKLIGSDFKLRGTDTYIEDNDMKTISAQEKERYMSMIGKGGKKILHIEHWSNPDVETYLTGIAYYEHPRECRQRLAELWPMLNYDDSAHHADHPKL